MVKSTISGASREQSSGDVLTRISRVGQGLGTSFNSLLDAIPDCPPGATELSAFLGINRLLAQRLLTAVRRRDPLATAHLVPGPEPLRRVIKAAARRGIDRQLINAAEDSIAEFERLIRRVAGDRSSLDAIICSSLPGVRDRFETEAKQNAYRGMRQLKGVAADVSFFTSIAHPSLTNEDRIDAVVINGLLGLRCIRPNVNLKLGVRSRVDMESLPLTLEGKPMVDPHETFLHQYCTDEPIVLKRFECGKSSVFSLDWGDSVGLESARDIVMAELRLAVSRRHRVMEDESLYGACGNDIMVPTRMHIFDLLLHESVYPNWKPAVRILETGIAGIADPNDMTRDLDELDVLAPVEELGWGIDKFRAEEVPHYMEILDMVCIKRQWDRNKFRGYRVRIQYPIYSTQVQFRFDLPKKPQSRQKP